MQKENLARPQTESWWYPLLTTILPSAVIPVSLATIFSLYLDSARWANEPFHSLVEGVGSFAAILLALFIQIMRRNNQLRPGYIWVATTLMGMGLLDGFHASVEPGLSFVWLHSIATLVGGLTFALVILPERLALLGWLQPAPYITSAASVVLGITSIVWPGWIPAMTINGSFTLTAELLNIIGGAGFLIAWFHFSWKRGAAQHEERLLLANHCLLFAMAGLLFHFSTLWDATWWLWHVLRLFAYLVLLWFFLDIYNRDVKQFRLAQQVIDNTSEAVVITNASGTILDINTAYSQISGYSRDELIGHSPSMGKSGRHDDAFYRTMWRCLKEEGHWSGEIWDRRKSGELFPKWLSINAIRNNRGAVTHYVGIFSDISEKKAAEERLQNLAFYDPLTSLPNRAMFRERLQKVTGARHHERKQVALMIIDLDGFKDVNDSLGHEAGDCLLSEIASRLQGRMRQSDIVARLGGDEFALLVEDFHTPEQLGSLAEELLEVIRLPLSINATEIHVGASIGIALFPSDADNSEDLTRHADTAMYHAKEAGKNRYQYFMPEMNRRAQERLAMIRALHKAVEQEAFEIFYQPKYLLPERTLYGMEALLRWKGEDGVMISPTQFIPCAEETSLINPLGDWVLRESFRQTQNWNQRFSTRLQLAVNLSTRQFMQSDLVEKIEQLLVAEEFDASLLELEITESLLMDDTIPATPLMQRLREFGITIAIDDFGTGYSSLSYLKRFPIDTLKIDRTFIRDLTVDSEDAAIVEAIINLGHTLDLNVVAEGVESEEQLAILQRLNCHVAQGYLLGHPMPASEFEALLARETKTPASS